MKQIHRVMLLLWCFSVNTMAVGADITALYEAAQQAYDEKKYRQAANLYEIAASKGSPLAQFQLGMMYKQGHGVKLNYFDAVNWLKKSALQGHVEAQYRLGQMYKKGQGVSRFYDQAAHWLTLAARQGHAKAQISLGVLYVTGNGVGIDYKKAVYWYQLAADKGIEAAQNNLGLMYEKGMGVERDYHQALSLYAKANTTWSKIRHAKLSKKVACSSSAKTRLFLTGLKCADRDVLMLAIKQGGVTVKNESFDNWGDTYVTSSKQLGQSDLFVAYTLDNEFAIARYAFSDTQDASLVNQIKDIVSASYGVPSLHAGKRQAGLSYQWLLSDGIEIEVNQTWPSNVTQLIYRDPQNYQNMLKAQEKQDIAHGRHRNQRQTETF